MSYSKFIIIIPTESYFLYRVYKNNHINSFNINANFVEIETKERELQGMAQSHTLQHKIFAFIYEK